jgi:hypothetical protein
MAGWAGCGGRVATVAALTALAVGCWAGPQRPVFDEVDREHSVTRIARDLDRLSRGLTRRHRDTFDEVLRRHLDQDPYTCLPPVERVLGPPSSQLRVRQIHGTMAHYGFFHGPMLYRVSTAADPGQAPLAPALAPRVAAAEIGIWLVQINVALDATASAETVMELPDCELDSELQGAVHCEGVPYPDAPGRDACPDVGRFEARASRHNLRALLRRWSREAEQYYNRDARHFGLPLRYDFEFFLADDGKAVRGPVDLRVPLALSCSRSPYFSALRSGWSLPIVAHEMAHYLGLLDEYEMLSGITSLYPKTPFPGAEQSRMGLSMKRQTRLLPLHHYLVLRRYHCDEPSGRDPFAGVLRSSRP